jgi:hypothetical protein
MASEVGADGTKQEFERAFKKVAQEKPLPRPKTARSK